VGLLQTTRNKRIIGARSYAANWRKSGRVVSKGKGLFFKHNSNLYVLSLYSLYTYMQTLVVPAAVINSTILVCLSPFNYTNYFVQFVTVIIYLWGLGRTLAVPAAVIQQSSSVCHCSISQLSRTICDFNSILVGSGAKPQPIYDSFKCVCQFAIVSLGHFSELGGFCQPPRGVEKILSLGGQKSS